MTKEYTGPEFEIEFARRWLDYVVGGKVGVDPRTQWECKPASWTEWYPHFGVPSDGDSPTTFRWKPAPKRMVKIGYYDSAIEDFRYETLVAPEVEAPADGTTVFHLDDGKIQGKWFSEPVWIEELKDGKVFLNPADRDATAEWLAVCRKGGQA